MQSYLGFGAAVSVSVSSNELCSVVLEGFVLLVALALFSPLLLLPPLLWCPLNSEERDLTEKYLTYNNSTCEWWFCVGNSSTSLCLMTCIVFVRRTLLTVCGEQPFVEFPWDSFGQQFKWPRHTIRNFI